MGEWESHHPKKGQELSDDEKIFKPLFELGQVIGTPGALQALQDAEQDPFEILIRHVTGDWGNLSDEDKKGNEFSVEKGGEIAC